MAVEQITSACTRLQTVSLQASGKSDCGNVSALATAQRVGNYTRSAPQVGFQVGLQRQLAALADADDKLYFDFYLTNALGLGGASSQSPQAQKVWDGVGYLCDQVYIPDPICGETCGIDV